MACIVLARSARLADVSREAPTSFAAALARCRAAWSSDASHCEVASTGTKSSSVQASIAARAARKSATPRRPDSRRARRPAAVASAGLVDGPSARASSTACRCSTACWSRSTPSARIDSSLRPISASRASMPHPISSRSCSAVAADSLRNLAPARASSREIQCAKSKARISQQAPWATAAAASRNGLQSCSKARATSSPSSSSMPNAVATIAFRIRIGVPSMSRSCGSEMPWDALSPGAGSWPQTASRVQ